MDSRGMRIQSKALLAFLSPLLLAVAAAYVQWAVFGFNTSTTFRNFIIGISPVQAQA